jgi:hypothetical protein
LSSHVLELKPAVSAASVLKRVKALKVPAWPAVVLIVMAGLCGYVSGRQNPVHHYVPYVGYPLVLDTTTGKACFSSVPKPSDYAGIGIAGDSNATLADPATPTGPAIPMCGK